MATATVHIENVGGFFGTARCFRLDPPRRFDGIEREYVTICVQPRIGQQAAEVRLYPALESGASATPQLLRRVGSFTVDDPLDLEGCYWMALQLVGGYQATTPEPQDEQ
ncbi:hypothetical protein [Nocardia sp. NPDC050793]|uniref:hypothetical protein n=1 Tax=Nocardia sp. NPDC050793 TaxID=3155159 RepID=UPI0033D802F7